MEKVIMTSRLRNITYVCKGMLIFLVLAIFTIKHTPTVFGDEQSTVPMKGAAMARPDDPALRYQRMQYYSAQNQPEKALEQVKKALELDPDNIKYLMARGALENWLKTPELAAQSFAHVLRFDPHHQEALLNLARSQRWSGSIDRAAKTYDRYCQTYPDDKAALIEYVITQGERGNFYRALKVLDTYKKMFGEDKPYRVSRATILAWADRPDAALEITEPLISEDPDNFDAHYAQTLALHYDNRPREALAGVEELARIRPDSFVTQNTRIFVNTPLRSNVWGSFDWFHDSDSIDLYQSRLQGELQIRPETKLLAGVKYNYQRADRGSGLEAVEGSPGYGHRVLYAGAVHRFLPYISADVTAGYAATDDDDTFAYEVGADFRILDSLNGRVERWYDFSLRSPRTTSLDIKEGVNTLALTWKPNVIYTVEGFARYGDLTDDNTFWESQLAPRVSVLRSQYLNLDVGPVAYFLGFSRDLDHGYYDPDFYQKYLIQLYWYWKINDNNGISLTTAGGIHKDDEMGGFRPAYDASLQGYFGIYKDLYIRVRLGVLHNLRESSDPYNRYYLGTTIAYRF